MKFRVYNPDGSLKEESEVLRIESAGWARPGFYRIWLANGREELQSLATLNREYGNEWWDLIRAPLLASGMSEETVDGFIQSIIEAKTKKAKMYHDIAARALERYQLNSRRAAKLEEEVLKLQVQLTEKALKKAG